MIAALLQRNSISANRMSKSSLSFVFLPTVISACFASGDDDDAVENKEPIGVVAAVVAPAVGGCRYLGNDVEITTGYLPVKKIHTFWCGSF